MLPHGFARRVNWTVPGVLVLLAMAVGVFVVAVEGAAQQFEEERPPIIVNNGSIVFEPQQRPADKTKGTWVGAGSIWRHEHPNPGPTALSATATPTEKPCLLKGSSITITYGASSTDFQVAVLSVLKQALQVDFGKNPPVHDPKTQRLIAYSNNSKVRILNATDGNVKCEFTSPVSLTVRQLR